MPLPITVTVAEFDTETKRPGKMGKVGWNSAQMDNVRAALVVYHAAIGAVAKNNAQSALMNALYIWKRDKASEFANRELVSGGLVLKLCVQAGLDDYRPPPCAAVQFHGTARVRPTGRLVPRVTRLDQHISAGMTSLAKNAMRPALVIIDLYGDDFAVQGMNRNFGSDDTVAQHIYRLINASGFDNNGRPGLIPTYVCSKSSTKPGAELCNVFGTALWTAPTLISSKTNSVLTETPLLADLQAKAITHVFVTGFDANMCVAASIFGTGGTGADYQPGFLDYGFDVVTSRFVLASGDRPLRAQDGWPYMGPHA